MFKNIKKFFLRYILGEKYLPFLYKKMYLFNKYKLTTQQKKLLHILENKNDVLICKGRQVGSTTITLYYIFKRLLEGKDETFCFVQEHAKQFNSLKHELMRIIDDNRKLIGDVIKTIDGIRITTKNGKYHNTIKFLTFNESIYSDLKSTNYSLVYLPQITHTFTIHNFFKDFMFLLKTSNLPYNSPKFIIETDMNYTNFISTENNIINAFNYIDNIFDYTVYDIIQKIDNNSEKI